MHTVWIKCFHLALSVFALQVLHQTFPQHTFLMNGLIHGVKVSTLHRRRVSIFCLSWQQYYSDCPAGMDYISVVSIMIVLEM